MDVAAFKAQLEAARRIEVEVAGAKFNLQLPTDHDFRRTVEANRDASGMLLEAQAFRAVLDKALTGWSGVASRLVAAEGSDEPLEFSQAARSLLLDNRQDIADALMLEIGRAMAERRVRREASAKN